MTITEYEKLTEEEICIEVAKRSGWIYRDGYIYGRLWKRLHEKDWREGNFPPDYFRGEGSFPPDYFRDLNVIREALQYQIDTCDTVLEKLELTSDYYRALCQAVNPNGEAQPVWNATAAQRCQALLTFR